MSLALIMSTLKVAKWRTEEQEAVVASDRQQVV